MKKAKKKFDSVEMMREIRDGLSKRFIDMSFEEQKEYIKEHAKRQLAQAYPKSSKPV